MKISACNNSVNFKGTPLYPVQIRKTTDAKEYVTGMLLKLDAKNPDDINLIKQLNATWVKWSTIINNYYKNFIGQNENKTFEHYAIKLQNENHDIAGVLTASSSENQKGLHLSYIISNPELTLKNAQRPLKGVGEILLGHVFHKAEKLKADFVDFTSSNNLFYLSTFKKAGIDLSEEMDYTDILENHFVVGPSNFKKYIRYCEEKYGFKFPN